jgi:hypothetical protein
VLTLLQPPCMAPPILQRGGQHSLCTVHYKNGVKLLDLLGVVRKLQSTEGTSAAHFSTLVLSQAKTSWPS